MKILENGLIPVYEGEKNNVVNARELHKFLEVGKDFTTWVKDKILTYGFVENEDYVIFPKIGENPGRPKTEYILTLDTAKEISMVQNNGKGSQARKYFIAVEKKYKQALKPMSQAELTAAIAQNQVEIERKANEALEVANKTSRQITNALDVFTTPSTDDWRHEINDKLNKMCIEQGLNYQTFRHGIYAELESTARVDLSSRQGRLKERLKKAGSTYREREAITKLDVVERDPKLKPIFEGIVRKYQAKYAVER